MDIGKAYTFMTKEEGWVGKILIAAVAYAFSFLILPYFILVGYQLGVMRNVIKGRDRTLPEWQEIGPMFMDGLYVIIAQFVYTLPTWLLFCLSYGFFLIPAFAEGDVDVQTGFEGIALAGYFVMLCVIILLGIALAFVIPAIYIHYVRTEDFGALFRVGEVLTIARENLVDILLTILAAIGAGIVLAVLFGISIITICGPFILMFVGPVWLMLANGHLYGQIAANMDQKPIEGDYAVAQ